jgi:hypothetical protein
MLRLLLLKFLPRRLLPLLLLYELYQLVVRARRNDRGETPETTDPRIIDGRATALPAREDAIR